MSGPKWGEPRSALAVIGDTFRLYRSFPLLFVVLAAAVVVPYQGILLPVAGSGRSGGSAGMELFLGILDLGVVLPLISALHVHAVARVREGERPRIAAVAKQGLKVLPVVAAASIVATLGMAVGFVFLIVPGVILWLRWSVVAQAAAIEREGWVPALSRSGDLVHDNYRHVFGVLVGVAAITLPPGLLLNAAFGAGSNSAASVLIGVVVGILTVSFAALAEAVLYFELRARLATRFAGVAQAPPSKGPPGAAIGPEGAVEETRVSLDPRAYSDEERPRGWYLDPTVPSRMRYWGGPGADGWVGNARTPRKTRRAWETEVGLRGEA